MAKSSFYENSPQAPGPAPAQSPANVSNANTTAPSSFYKGTGPLVGNGGSLYDLTQYGVLYGDGILAPLATAPGISGQILVGNTGAAPSFSSSPFISTSVTTPLLVGGTAAGSSLTLQSTSNGTPSGDTIYLKVGGANIGSLSHGGTLADGSIPPNFTVASAPGTNYGGFGQLTSYDNGGWTQHVIAWGSTGNTAGFDGPQSWNARGTPTVPLSVQNGDAFDLITSYVYTGNVSLGNAGYLPCAEIYSFIDGTPGINSSPGGWIFKTKSPGDVSWGGGNERLRIDSVGRITATGAGVQISATASGPLDITCDNFYYPSVNARVANQSVGWVLTAKDSGGTNKTSYVLGTADGIQLQAVTTGEIKFGFDNGFGSFVEHLRINNAGNVIHTVSGTVYEIDVSAGTVYQSQTLASPGVADGVYLADVYGPGSTPNYGYLRLRMDDVTGASEDASWRFGLITAGTTNEVFRVTGAGITNGGGTFATIWGDTASLQVNTTTPAPSVIIACADWRNAIYPASLYFTKSRSGTAGTHTVVQVDDQIGYIAWAGSNGTDFSGGDGAFISAFVDVVPAAGLVPLRLSFGTGTADGNGSPERLRIDSNGRIKASTLPYYSDISVDGANSQFQITTNGSDWTIGGVAYSNSIACPTLMMAKSRSTSGGSFTIVQADDYLGQVTFYGDDGVTFREGGMINVNVDGTPSSTVFPTRMSFWITPATDHWAIEAARIDSNGGLTVGTTSGQKIVIIPSNNTVLAGYDGMVLRSDTSYNFHIDSVGDINCHIDADNNGSSSFRVVNGTGTTVFEVTELASVIVNSAAIATNATDGFLYIPTCAGTPTGTPTTNTGRSPIVYDTTNNKLYAYNGAWKSVTLT